MDVVAHLGPTNSGKTYAALEYLSESGEGVYAAPLRMLAQEAYWGLSEIHGADNVALITGEEKINESAPIICCTAEMAPRSGKTLLLDEVQWARDKERGYAWTSLMIRQNYDHLRLIGSLDALPLINKAFPEAEINFHERLVPLEYIRPTHWEDLKEETVVIAFSKRCVLWIAGVLGKFYGEDKISVLYGDMPPETRRTEIKKFIKGETKYIVSTDVLGHGINLPAKAVLFAETNKFDGQNRRELYAWEAAQIAGRAGRYGLQSKGSTGILITPEDYLDPRIKTVRKALNPSLKYEGHNLFRKVDSGYLRPTLHELDITDSTQMSESLKEWQENALGERKDWVRIQNTESMRARIELINQALQNNLDRISLEKCWTLVNAPVDPESSQAALFGSLAKGVADDETVFSGWLPTAGRIDYLKIKEAETLGRNIQLLRWFVQVFPEESPWEAYEVAEAESLVSKRILYLVRQEVKDPTIGKCLSCSTEIAPWFDECYDCKFGYRDNYNWEEESVFN